MSKKRKHGYVRKTTKISAAEFMAAHRDPRVNHPRGKAAMAGHNPVHHLKNGIEFIQWTCTVCNHRNDCRYYPNDIYVCSSCNEGFNSPSLR